GDRARHGKGWRIGIDKDPAAADKDVAAEEDVIRTVRVRLDEVGCERLEGDKASVGADRQTGGKQPTAEVVRLPASAVHAHPLGLPCGAIVDEDVRTEEGVAPTVRVPGDEIGGRGGEGDEAPVGADRRGYAVVVRLPTSAVEAHALGCPRLAVPDKHVR